MGAEKQPMSLDERLWTVEEVAEFLGLGRTAVYKLVSMKQIPNVRVLNKLRFIPEQMRAWAKKKSQTN